MTEAQVPKGQKNRWLIAIMGTLLQLCLGTVYAWSFFQKPLMTTYGWSNSQVAWVFSLAICFLGLAAAWGGINLPKYGPKKLAMIGGALFGAGYLIGAFALSITSLPLLYLGYGVIGGTGLGLGYVTPVATAAKWFPDKKGFITGMVVMGFGFGALLMSKIFAPMLIEMTSGNMVLVFAYLGAIFLVLTLIVASFLENPPAGYTVQMKSNASDAAKKAAAPSAHDLESGTFGQYVFNRRFFVMWVIFFCNIGAGIAIIGFQSPMLQDLLKLDDPSLDVKTLASMGATLIAVTSIFNGIGRFFWGGISDKIGRVNAFRIMLVTQLVCYVALIFVQSPMIFSILFCYILLCYGGGFGTMPSFVTTVFGSKMMAVVYGAILTAWSMGGIVGPQVVAFIKDTAGSKAAPYSFVFAVTLMVVGIVFSLMASDKHFSINKSKN
jgi:OFA family oxalate/formate antiporter-like MFS transporter